MSFRFFRAHWLAAFVIASACVAAAPDTASAQRQPPSITVPDSGQTQVLRLRDGSTLVGRVTSVDGPSFRFRTAQGELTVALADVAELRVISEAQMHNGAYAPNPNVARLFFAPTGRMLQQGEGYFSDIMLFFAHAGTGVTNQFTLGVGASLFPTDNFIDNNIFYVTPKVGVYQSETVNFAVGALAISVPSWEGARESAGLLYGVGTFGKPNASFTAGMGWGYSSDDLADKPIIMLGAETRLSRRVSFVTENYFLPGVEEAGLSYGLRFFGEKLSVDLAFINSASEPVFPGFPFVGFAVAF